MNQSDYVTQLDAAGLIDQEQLSEVDRDALNDTLTQADVDTLISIRQKLPAVVLRRGDEIKEGLLGFPF